MSNLLVQKWPLLGTEEWVGFHKAAAKLFNDEEKIQIVKDALDIFNAKKTVALHPDLRFGFCKLIESLNNVVIPQPVAPVSGSKVTKVVEIVDPTNAIYLDFFTFYTLSVPQLIGYVRYNCIIKNA